MDKEIKEILDALLKEHKKADGNIRKTIVKAFIAGQKFQEEKIKKGIEIVFESLDH